MLEGEGSGKCAQHDVVFINFFDKSVACFAFEALCQTFATTLWPSQRGERQSHLLNAWPSQTHTHIHKKRTHTHTDIDSPVQHRVVPRIHSEALEKRKSNKLNWFVRSYFACSPHSPPPPPSLPLPLPRPAHSSIALRFALLSSKVLWSFLSVFCNFPARFSAKVLKFAVRVLCRERGIKRERGRGKA